MPSSASRPSAAARLDGSGTGDEGITRADISNVLLEEHDIAEFATDRTPRRLWTGPPSSASTRRSFATTLSLDGVSLRDERDEQFIPLTAGVGPHTDQASSGSRRPRDYDAEGRARVGPLGMLARSPTVRRVSQTVRKASVRVVNIMGNEKGGYAGLTRQSSPDNNDTPPPEAPQMEPPEPPDQIPEPARARSPPAPGAGDLRGRTLCLFTASNPIRIAMERLLRFPLTEPIILILIMVNVVVVTIQVSPALFDPREGGSFLRSWEDYVLLALFITFTIEMFARIIVTGLILDPETTVAQFIHNTWAFIVREARADDDTARGRRGRQERWHDVHPTGVGAKTINTKPVMLSEVPFQEALLRQRGVLEENRPYLRHSWHRIDMVAILCFWINFILAMTGKEATSERHLFIFRALSILRATRLLVSTSGTATILHSLKRAGPLILKVAWFIVFAAALFSIIGVQSFRGSLRRACVYTNPMNSTDEIILGTCGGHVDPVTLQKTNFLNLDGTPSNVPAKGYICPLNQICQTQDESLGDDSQSFDNIFRSLVQVLIIAGVNTWTDTMYQTMDAEYFASTLFFIVAIIVLNFWLMNLLVAVVVNTFQDIRADTKRSAFGADQSILTEPEWAQDPTKKSRETSKFYKWYMKSELFWVALICVDLIAQATKTNRSSPAKLRLLDAFAISFAIVWVVEIVIRMAAYAPDWRSFIRSSRNDFDLFLAIGCAIIQIPPIRNWSAYPWLTVFPLLRWYRVILVVPRMKPLLGNIFGSFTGLLNMVFFLFLMNFLSALMAVQLLRGDMDESTSINFSGAWNSFLAMYQIFSTENWTEVLYGAMVAERQYGQQWIVCIFLFLWFMFANFILMQMFIAVINENFSIAEEQKRKQQIESFIRRTEPSSAHGSWVERWNPYRLIKGRHKAVKVDAVPQNLILPLKQSIGADVGDLNLEKNADDPKAAMKRLLGMDDQGLVHPLDIFTKFRKVAPHHKKRQSHGSDADADGDDDDRGLTDILPPINAGPSVDEHKDNLRERRNQQADFISAHPSYDHSLWLFKQKNPIRRACQALVPPAYGHRIFGRPEHPIWSIVYRAVVFIAVVTSIVIAAVSSPHYRKEYYSKHGVVRGTWFDLSEAAIATVFILEAVIKIIADGFIFAPNAYLLSVWNFVDFMILLTVIVNTVSELVVIGGVNRATRALKAFRALRLITLFARLRDTFHIVFFAGFTRILDASVLMILYLIPFAIWGLNIFSRRLASCNDTDVAGRVECIGEYLNSAVGDIEFLSPRVWANPQFGGSVWAFDSFRQSILILFEIVSLEGWTDTMKSAMDIVGIDEQPQTNASQANSVFFIIFNLFGGVIILTVFLSIIIENFSVRSGTALLTAEQRQWDDMAKFIRQQTPSERPKQKPTTPIRKWCYNRATEKRGYWERFYTVLYFAHLVLLMTEDFSNTVMTETQFDFTFLILTILYAVDVVVRFVGLGFRSFRSNGWNIFDVIVITGSFATTIPALQANAAGLPGSVGNKQVQKLFLVAVGFKLVQRLDSLNQLFKTSVASLPAIGNLFLLWAVLFLFAAIVYMEVFGLTKLGNNAETRYQNYYSYGNALVMLAFMSTGEGWNGYMHDYTVEFPRCTQNKNYLFSDCGSVGWAYALFTAWNILSMYIILNMFTGVVVASFSYVYQMPGAASLDREEIRSFKHIWSQVDVDRTGYIKRKDFTRFFAKLNGVFEVRLYPSEYTVPNMMRESLPDPNSKHIIHGAQNSVDVNKLETQIASIDFTQVRARRRAYARLYYEAKMSEEPGRGISFTNMLFMLAHYKLIDDEKALRVDDLLIRRAKNDRVEDLVNLDRVRGLIRTIYWRRRFLHYRDQSRNLGPDDYRHGLPTIVLESTDSPEQTYPSSPQPSIHTIDGQYPIPLQHLSRATTPPRSPRSPDTTPPYSPNPSSPNSPSRSRSNSPRQDLDDWSQDHSLSAHSSHFPDPSHLSHNSWRQSHMSSDRISHLSADDISYRVSIDEPDEDILNAMSTSIWGDMMREAVDNEDEDDNHER